MLKQHTFNIVMVDGVHGSDSAVADKIDKTVIYAGKPMIVKL